MLLAIDTSTRFAGVALADVEQVVACRVWRSRTNHSAELMPAAAQILKDHDTPPSSLSGIAVALGPGGFSALRVGLSVAKGLAAACSLPLVGVGTLRLEAFPYLGSGMPVCAMVEAGRGEVAAAVFGPEDDRCERGTDLPAGRTPGIVFRSHHILRGRSGRPCAADQGTIGEAGVDRRPCRPGQPSMVPGRHRLAAHCLRGH